jgi:transcriptional regulator with XRE-family HTH domain
MSKDVETFGTRLKRLREEAGLTQQELATAVGVHKSSIAKIEQNLHEPAWGVVQAIAKALGTTSLAFEGTAEHTAEAKTPGKRGRPRKSSSEPASEPEPTPEPPAEKKGKRKKGE